MHPKHQGHCAGIRKAGSMREPIGQVGGDSLSGKYIRYSLGTLGVRSCQIRSKQATRERQLIAHHRTHSIWKNDERCRNKYLYGFDNFRLTKGYL